MRHRLIEGAIALALALGAFAVPSGAAPVQAGSSCTGWSNTLLPPQTIRVYRTALGRVDTVPFRRYVEVVLVNEWGPRTPPAALRAGAVAVKQFGWYYTTVWRGGSIKGHCYDVRDSTRDQVYNPAKPVYANAKAAVAATWGITVRKGSRFFLTGFRPGTRSCTANIDGWHLFQTDASACVKQFGDSTVQVLHRFYTSAHLITAGVGDITGDLAGDAPVLVTDATTGEVTARLYSTDATTLSARTAAAARVLTAAPATELVGRGVGDVNADGRPDLVQVLRHPNGVLTVQAMRATGAGFTAAATWWSAPEATAAADWSGDLRVVVADFDGDFRADVGIVRLVPGTDGGAPRAELWVMLSTGTSFAPPRRYWEAGPATDLTGAAFTAADVNGDGRADLIIMRDVGNAAAPATAFDVAISSATSNSDGLLQPVAWKTLAGTALADIRVVPTDLNLDGLADLYLLTRTGDSSMSLRSAISTGTAFSITTMPTNIPLDYSWADSQFIASDVIRDGRPDMVMLTDAGTAADGTSRGIVLRRLVTNGTRVEVRGWLTDPTIPYSSAGFP